MAERTAAWLAASGVQPQSRVAILAENDDVWCAVYLGILRAAAVAVPLDTAYSAGQIGTVFRDSGVRVAFVSPKFLPAAHAAAAGMTPPPRLVMIRGQIDGLPSMKDVLDGARAGSFPPVSPSDAAVMLYTSGTTSDPKGVVLSHGNLAAERAGAFAVVRVDERDAILSVLPLYHALAQMANLLLPFTVGARVVFLETVNTGELARALKDRGITTFVCVPQFFYLLHQRIEAEIAALPLPVRGLVRALAAANLRLRTSTGLNPGRVLFRKVHASLSPTLRLLVTGGARFDPEINRALHALGFSIRQAYGLTECSGAATVTDAGDCRFESVGRPIPGAEIRIAPRVQPAASDEERADGEVLIGGPIVMGGYYNRPEQNAQTLRDGWLHTGDLGYQDRDGRLYITGRSKEVIVLGSGKNIYPEEIEAHYARSVFIQELCVVGLSRPGSPAAERLHALIKPDQDAMRVRGAVNIRELLRFEIETLSVQLPAHKRILGYDVTLDPLPRTTTRKIKRFEVERQLRERMERAGQEASLDEAGGAWPEHPQTTRVVEMVREGLPPGAVLVPDAHLELDLGLDSMERVELLIHVTSALGIEIPDADAQAIHTAGDLVKAAVTRAGDIEDAIARVQPWARLLEQLPADRTPLVELERLKRLRTLMLFVVLKVMYATFRVATGLRVRGREHLPADGTYLISPNHQSYIDSFMLVSTLPFRTIRRLFFVGAAEYFQTPLTAWLARALNVVPIDPDANLVGAMQAGAHGLRLGKVLVLFPEGERSIDGTVKTFRKGAAILSHHLGAPIVPVAIDGAWDVWARGRSLNWRALLPWSGTRVRMTFGAPIAPPPVPEYDVHTTRLRAEVIDLWDRLHLERTGTRAAAPPEAV